MSESQLQFAALAAALKQINATFGQLGKDTLVISTVALNGSDADDATYTRLENELTNVGATRDDIVGRMLTLLESAEFNGQPINARDAAPLILEADLLLEHKDGGMIRTVQVRQIQNESLLVRSL